MIFTDNVITGVFVSKTVWTSIVSIMRIVYVWQAPVYDKKSNPLYFESNSTEGAYAHACLLWVVYDQWKPFSNFSVSKMFDKLIVIFVLVFHIYRYNWNSNPRPLLYRCSALPTELSDSRYQASWEHVALWGSNRSVDGEEYMICQKWEWDKLGAHAFKSNEPAYSIEDMPIFH